MRPSLCLLFNGGWIHKKTATEKWLSPAGMENRQTHAAALSPLDKFGCYINMSKRFDIK